jgi:uncharacterized protein YqcC (DUF446 family)
MTHDLYLMTLLQETECLLRTLNLWCSEKPDDTALASDQPFALDTLEPEQWLQWVFIPKMINLLEKERVPKGFSIAPYFEEVWKNDSDKSALLSLLHNIDEECR